MSLGSNLIHTCTVLRDGDSKDAYGNRQGMPVEIDWRVPCRLVEQTQRVVADEGASGAYITTYRLLTLPDSILQEGDRVTHIVLEDGTVVNRIFRVASLVDRHTWRAHHKSAALEMAA